VSAGAVNTQKQILTTKRTKNTKNELKKVNHKGHKEHIGREARKIKFLRPLPFDFAQVVSVSNHVPCG